MSLNTGADGLILGSVFFHGPDDEDKVEGEVEVNSQVVIGSELDKAGQKRDGAPNNTRDKWDGLSFLHDDL
jgi:hypothetical protein